MSSRVMAGRKPLRTRAAGLVPLVLLGAVLGGCGATKHKPVQVVPRSHPGLAYLNGNGDVVVANARGANTRVLGPGSQALLAPDGSVVAALVGGSGGSESLTTYQTVRQPRPRIAYPFGSSEWTAGSIRLLAWSPDSRVVALVAWRMSSVGEQPELLVVNVTTGKIATIAAGNFFGASFAPSLPDRLVYSRATVDQLDSDRAVLFSAEPDGADIHAITNAGLDEEPVWAASGIVFARLSEIGTTTSAPRYNLWLVQPTGSGLRELTSIDAGRPAAGTSRAPLSVSASGTHIVANFFSPHSRFAIDVWIVDVQPRRIVAERLKFGNAQVVAQGISADGSSILLSPPGPALAPIETSKWGSSVLTQLVSAGSDPSRNH